MSCKQCSLEDMFTSVRERSHVCISRLDSCIHVNVKLFCCPTACKRNLQRYSRNSVVLHPIRHLFGDVWVLANADGSSFGVIFFPKVISIWGVWTIRKRSNSSSEVKSPSYLAWNASRPAGKQSSHFLAWIIHAPFAKMSLTGHNFDDTKMLKGSSGSMIRAISRLPSQSFCAIALVAKIWLFGTWDVYLRCILECKMWNEDGCLGFVNDLQLWAVSTFSFQRGRILHE